jgi:hypothetical protein
MVNVRKLIHFPDHLMENLVLAIILISFITLIVLSILHFNAH